MIQHYFKIALRNLAKYKLQSAISIVGVAIGVTFFIFSLHWLRYETSYDSFYPKANRTFLVYTQSTETNSMEFLPIMATFIRQYCPEVEDVTCSFRDSGMDYVIDEKTIKTPDFLVVDSSFTNIFPQKILYGVNPTQDYELIISETLARKFWKTPQEALGITIKQQAKPGIYLPNPLQLKIVGIMADAPANSSFHYTGYFQVTNEAGDINNEKEWRFANALIHITLREGVNRKDFTQHLLSSLKNVEHAKNIKPQLVSLSDKHFEFAPEESFSSSFIRMFVAATILLLSCVLFNFLNLFLNRYYQRSREVKLRKSMGANNAGLTKQTITEVFTHCLIAYLLSGCLLEIFTPFFEQTFQISIQKSNIWLEYFAAIIISLCIIGITLIFPIIQFIRTSTKYSLISKIHTRRHNTFRRVSLSVQLIICLFFLTSTSVLYMQLRFIHNTDIGFNTQNIIELFVNTREQNGSDMLEEIKKLPMIQSFTTASDYIVGKTVRHFENYVEWEGQTEEDKKAVFAGLSLTKDGDKIFNFRLIEGREYTDEDWVTRSDMPKNIFGSTVLNKVLINESAVTVMRMEHPVGKIIRIPIGMVSNGDIQWHYTDYEIIGIVKDFHSQGMKSKVTPTIISQAYNWQQYINYFQVVPGTEKAAIAAINNLAKKHQWEYGGYNVAPQTVESKIQELNKSETATFRLFSILTFLCILISLFGIFSISASIITQRQKEIAVRKVMGATVSEIIGMFFKEYIILVCVSAIIAFPCAYYVMSRWLEQYAYHVSISVDIFIVILGTTIILVLLTVLQQVLRTARQNPAEVIKSE